MKLLLKRGILILLSVMLLTIPMIPSFAIGGSYNSDSMALLINDKKTNRMVVDREAGWPAAIVAGVVLVAAVATGVIDGWNSIHPTESSIELEELYSNTSYQKYDFEKFDN